MRNLRTYYSAEITEFLRQSNNEILGVIHSNDISLMQPYSRAILGRRLVFRLCCAVRMTHSQMVKLKRSCIISRTDFCKGESIRELTH